MFLGHFGVAMMARSKSQDTRLGTLFAASQFLDLIWPFFIIFGLETVSSRGAREGFHTLSFISYPYSHSLLFASFWAIVFAIWAKLAKKKNFVVLLLAVLVLSHWVLDWIVHEPDLPLAFHDEIKHGLNLWANHSLTLIIELFIFSSGVVSYLRAIQLETLKKKVIFFSLIAFLLIIFVMSAFGPPPALETSAVAIGGPALAMWLFVWWGNAVEGSNKSINGSR